MDWSFLFLNTRGRLTPSWFFVGLVIYSVVYGIIVFLVMQSVELDPLWRFVLTSPGLIWYLGTLPLVIKRLHDIGWSGFYSLVYLIVLLAVTYFAWTTITPSNFGLIYAIPFVAFYFFMVVLTIPGTARNNPYRLEAEERPMRFFGRLLLD
jgi:uncharacterized membrane protein YhaH (DUF805 family)